MSRPGDRATDQLVQFEEIVGEAEVGAGAIMRSSEAEAQLAVKVIDRQAEQEIAGRLAELMGLRRDLAAGIDRLSVRATELESIVRPAPR
jgi:hypothetical protein